MLDSFRPSDVVIVGALPFTGTLNHVEREVAAALIVRVCQVEGDRWQSVALAQIVATFEADIAAQREPWATMNRNPFLPPPGFDELVAHGFAGWTGDRERIELTAAALDAIARRWRRPAEEVPRG